MTQTVVLIPGFLGFNHLGNHTYFADRFVAGLSMTLKLLGGDRQYRVVTVPSIPIGSLAKRQEMLVETLNTIHEYEISTSRWHLVGHSTGGLDAAFLTRTHPLEAPKHKGPSYFGKVPRRPFDQHIASVTAIATPFYGSTLALCAAAQMMEFGPRKASLQGVKEAIEGGAHAVSGSLKSRIPFALGVLSGRNQTSFIWDLLFSDGLAVDLRPEVASTLTRTDNGTGVPHLSIVTFAPDPCRKSDRGLRSNESVSGAAIAGFVPGARREPAPASETEVDSLFRQLHTLVAHAARGPRIVRPPPLPDLHRYPLIAAKGHEEVHVTPESSDGVVNTERQVFGEIAGVVVGDHADVLGQYRRADPTAPGKNLEDGLLTSGAHFGDAQFFALINLVAQGILDS